MYQYRRLKIALIAVLFLTGCSSRETTTPQRADIKDAVFANGNIILDNEYLVTANTEAYITQALMEEGDTVTKGTELFLLSNEIQSSQLANAKANYANALNKLQPNAPKIAQLKLQIAQAEEQLAIDQKNYERYAELVKTHAVSQQEFERVKLQYENAKRNVNILEESLEDLKNSLQLNLENARTQLDIQKENTEDYFLTSEMDGIVLNIYKNQGELVRRGEAVAKIGGGEVLIKLYVAEEDIDRIKIGQEVIVSLNTHEDQLFEATISRIYPAFDETEQSFLVKARFFEKPQSLFANTQLQANIITTSKDDALIIPTAYLLRGDSVLLEDQGRVSVQVGIRNPEWVEILSGLDTAQIIVVPNTAKP
ncbi:MAG: efflux RND transporter periplasmic adaptor subunit [Cyclobacteriaceae bacterium]